MKRQRALFVPLLALAAVAGFTLGACGGGDGSALATLTGLTTTRPGLTAAPPAATVTSPLTTAEVTTSEIETTEIETTAPEPTTPSETTPAPALTIEPETTPVEEEQPAEPAASTTSTPWGWIILGVVLAAALVAGIVIWRRRQAGSAAWSRHMADLTQRCFVLLDDVLAQGSVVTGRVQAVAAEAQTLETRAPDDLSRRAAGRLRAQLAELTAALETDRALRLGSPPPSAEQLSYSTALIRQQVTELQGVLRPPGGDSASA